jgi:hypothetical protein
MPLPDQRFRRFERFRATGGLAFQELAAPAGRGKHFGPHERQP